MDKFSRAQRRHDRARLKRARKTYWCYSRREPMPPGTLNSVVDTPHPCSGWCCGNPRRWFGQRTRAEARFLAESVDSPDQRG